MDIRKKYLSQIINNIYQKSYIPIFFFYLFSINIFTMVRSLFALSSIFIVFRLKMGQNN